MSRPIDNKHAFAAHRILIGLWQLQGGLCAYCGVAMPHPDSPSRSRPLTNPTIDHMTPIARGGKDDDLNRVAACVGCNDAKGQLDLPTFMRVRRNDVMWREARRQSDAEGRRLFQESGNARR